MTQPTIIFAGAGDLASRALTELKTQQVNAHTIAIARSPKTLSADEFWQGNLQDEKTQQQIVGAKPTAIVVTLVPNGQGAQGYQQGYIQPLQALLSCLDDAIKKGALTEKPHIIFASSTGVYHQAAGELVDEDTETRPTNFSGQTMLQAEQLLHSSGAPYCAVRLGGIYGEGRDFLIRQVQAGKGGSPEYTNRIHQDDAGRCLAFLAVRVISHEAVPDRLVVCDSEPAPSSEVRQFIAQQLGLNAEALEVSASGRGGNKRCNNHQLLALGFSLNYPSYRDGYRLDAE